MYCGATENEMALKDLKAALALQPGDPMLRREYTTLKGELDAQRSKDSRQFGGLFERGRVVEEGGGTVTGGRGGAMTVEEALRSLKDAESACQVNCTALLLYHI